MTAPSPVRTERHGEILVIISDSPPVNALGEPWGPPGLPQPIVQRFHGELLKAMNTPDMNAWYDANGFLYIGSTPEQLKAMQQKGFESFGRMFKALGMKPD